MLERAYGGVRHVRVSVWNNRDTTDKDKQTGGESGVVRGERGTHTLYFFSSSNMR